MNGYLQNGDYNNNVMDRDNRQHANNTMMMMGQEGMGGGMVGGQSLDEIVNQNAKAIRRQSMPSGYADQQNNADPDMRRVSMMNYSGTPPAASMGYQYAPSSQAGMMSGNATPAHTQQQQNHSRHQSNADLSLQTSFPEAPPHYNAMMQPPSAYQSPAHPSASYDVSMSSPYVDGPMGMQMDYSDQSLGNGAPTNPPHMNMYSQSQFSQGMMQSSPMQYSGSQTPMSARPPLRQDPGGGSRNNSYGASSSRPSNAAQAMSRRQSSQNSAQTSPAHAGVSSNAQPPSSAPQDPQMQSFNGPMQPVSQDQELGNASRRDFDGMNGPVHPVRVDASTHNPNNQQFEWDAPEGGWPSTMAGRPHMQTTYKNVYSSSGFDMLGVLMRVATRPDPEINIGSVDLSCAFVVCDAERDDCPIVYCSDNFERLTGYTKHMILGRNCRFLQSPDGNVEPGKRRKYVDDDSVLYLKNMINLQRESQISLINYRRGGQPFMNLLTMIPIAWDTDQIKFFVGFQVDLVEQPNAVTNKNPDGSYAINYQRGVTMPRYVLSAPENTQKMNLGQTVPRDEVSTIISTIGTGESDYAKRMWDKVLLENTDDVIHVLSLKGLFQWVSPSALRVLEYEPAELVGTALSSVCHPSDIVPVTRELKDTSSGGAAVNIVFRIRRKNSGYMWFEGNGSLHTEQGKGRKSIILVGRERPIYTLSKSDLNNAGGIGENELWTKMSTAGMFLYVASNVRQLLDRQPEELVGISIQSLMRADSKTEFGRILEHSRNGKKASVKHELINRRGQVLSAFTTLYPGDATEGQKPTFILGQTRLIKFTRGPTAQRPNIFPKQEHDTSDTVSSPAANSNVQTGTSTPGPTSGAQTPRNHIPTETSAITTSGQQGLRLGHQDQSLASEDNLFDELKTTKSSSWQYEIRQLEKRNRMLAEEVQALIAAKKKRKRRRGKDQQKDCANCHTRVTPEWRRGPSGQRDLCNSCGLRWAKINGRVSPRASSAHSAASDKASKASKASASPRHTNSTPSGIKTESPANVHSHSATPATGGFGSVGPPGGGGGGMEGVQQSPRQPAVKPNPPEGHGASMEGSHGVPAKIEEGVEEG